MYGTGTIALHFLQQPVLVDPAVPPELASMSLGKSLLEVIGPRLPAVLPYSNRSSETPLNFRLVVVASLFAPEALFVSVAVAKCARLAIAAVALSRSDDGRTEPRFEVHHVWASPYVQPASHGEMARRN